jgi:uncharacterized protein YjbI with pentapeptide repeats
MKILNPTPFTFAPYAGRMTFPGHSMTLIVKGSFDLVHEAVAEPADEQPFPTGDEPYPDDDEGQGSARYESDFAYFKPLADLLLAGTCHAPGGRAVRECGVRFQVGRYAKSLIVNGDRHWRGPIGFRQASEAIPFSERELRFEGAYRGQGHDPNPVGVGHGKADDEDAGRILPLPHLEDPDARMTSSTNKPDPAGFGPLGRTWKRRAAFLGTYKNSWLKNRWPWFPEDFDFAHFNAALPEMQVPYLAGDEALQFENLHPEHANYQSRLPGLRVRCFLNEIGSSETQGGERFHEVAMNLDTLWVDMDTEKLILVWRGVADARSSEFEGIEHVYIRCEPLGEAPALVEDCRLEFVAALEAADAAPEAEPIPAEEVAAPSDEAPADEDAESPDTETMRDEVRAGALAVLAGLGIGMTSLPEEAERSIESMTEPESNRAQLAAKEREDAEAELKKNFAQLGLDPENLPPVSAKALAEQHRMLSEMGVVDPAEMMSDPNTALMLSTVAAILPKVGLDPEDLTPLIEHMPKLPDSAEPEEDVAPEFERVRPLTREIVEIEAARGESFSAEDLSGLDLSALDLSGLDFSQANLAGAQLTGADLSAANLSAANCEGANLDAAILTGANLEGANLSEASLAAAILPQANLSGCQLSGACLDGADLSEANLSAATLTGASCCNATFIGAAMQEVQAAGMTATRAIFVEADVSAGDFAGADLSTADFSKGVMSGANFRGASLVNATVDGVTCVGADFGAADCTQLRASGASDFSRCSFSQIKADESIWEQAILTEADFSYSQMKAANFLKASMQRANLNAAEMSQARFMGADLREAEICDANLFEGSFERADLSGADLRGANLYAAEFLDAELGGALLEGANVKRSKLA